MRTFLTQLAFLILNALSFALPLYLPLSVCAALPTDQQFDSPSESFLLQEPLRSGLWDANIQNSPRIFPTAKPLDLSQINYKIFGDLRQGTPLVILHGLNSSLETFMEVTQVLAKKRPVVIYDHRGCGNSAEPGAGYDIDILAQDLEKLVNGLGINIFDLHGHSAGGFVALRFAGAHPERVRSLSIEDVAGLPIKERKSSMAEDTIKNVRFLRSLPKKLFNAEEFRNILFPLIGDNEALQSNFMKKSEVAAGVFDPHHAAGVEELLLDVVTRDLSASFQKYTGPILMMQAGNETRYFTRNHLQTIQQLRPNARIVQIPGAGHSIHVDQPQRWKATLENFLANLNSTKIGAPAAMNCQQVLQ